MLKLREKIASNLEDFVKIVLQLGKKENKQGESVLWFRGQASARWKLVPRLYRYEYANPKAEDDENRELFAVRAPDLSDVKPANQWDWYFVMQHYGAPTRLLDWTEGALHGLYFAIRENKGCDAAVWVLNPWKLNRKVVRKDEVCPPGDPGVTEKDRKRYEKWLRDRFAKGRWARWPTAIYPGYLLRRISAQRSCFTIHGTDQRGLEKIVQELGIPLTKIVIPGWQVTSIKDSLLACGIDETTVFPDLEGLGRAFDLCWYPPEEEKPHAGVYTRLGRSKVDKDGIGVFAITPIKKQTELFHGDCEEMVWIDKKGLPRRPRQIRKLYDDFAVIKTDEKDKKTRYGCPLNFNRLTVSWYLNHSSNPNVVCDRDYNFFALRDIERGEELTVDYSTYSEEP